MSKTFWAVIIAIIVVFGGIFWITGNKNSSTSSSSAKPSQHIEGQGSTGVTLVEYGDFECPYCGEFYPIVKQVEQQYDSQIHFQFRNLPLSSVHPNAFAGARAAEAASLQGKFWQMHDALYENQDPTGKTGWVASSDPLDQYFIGFAQQIGLNVTQFKTDFKSSKVNDTINADVTQFGKDYKAATGSFNAATDTATPTFFLDGKHIQPGYSAADFSKYIDPEIKAKTSH